MKKERNLYFETVEALFKNGKTPKDIANVKYTDFYGTTYTVSWREFAAAARKFNYTTTEEGHIVNDSLEINGMDGAWQICRAVVKQAPEEWVYLWDASAGDREIDPMELSSFDEDLIEYMKVGTGGETYYD